MVRRDYWVATVFSLSVTFAAAPVAAGLSTADVAWIETCVTDRKSEQLDPIKLRKYCACMQQIVEDNEPFSVSELERSYPPAHVMCKGKAGF